MALCLMNLMKSKRRLADQSGIALAIVLLILVVILLLGTTLIGLSVTENQAGSTVADTKKAFFAAETGLQEAMYRMRLDPVSFPNSVEGNPACSATADPVVVGQQGTSSPDPTNATIFWKYNPPACSWSYTAGGGYGGGTPGNFLGGNAGNLDSAGRTFTSSGSSHVTGGALANANLANGASYTVTVAPVVGLVGGCWQYVDQLGLPLGSCNPPVASNPMFKVTSTGTAKSARKTLSTMIRRYNINPKPDGALTANSYVNVQSASTVIDGDEFDCYGNTIVGTGVKAVTVPSGETVTINKNQNLQCNAGNGVNKCKGTTTPFPSTLGALLLGQGANSQDVQHLNDYLDGIKVPPSQAPTSAFNGVVYINGDYTQPPNISSGILIVHNATNTANLGNSNGGTFKGLVIADQIGQINGNAQFIGAVIAYGTTGTVNINDLTGTPSIKYSQCVLAGLSKYFPYEGVRGTWLEH